MRARFASAWTQALLGALIICAAAGTLYGLAKILGRHGPKVVDFVGRMPLTFKQALGLAVIAIFWAFLLSPFLISIPRHKKARKTNGHAKG